MAKPLKKAEAEARLRGTAFPAKMEALRRLPEDVDAALVLEVVQGLLTDRGTSTWHFARNCQALPVSVLRPLLASLEGLARGSRRAAAGDLPARVRERVARG